MNSTFDQLWDTMSERVLDRNLVSRIICDTRLDNKMTHGNTFNREYLSALPRPRQTIRYVDGVLRATPFTNETLTVNKEPEIWTDLADGAPVHVRVARAGIASDEAGVWASESEVEAA